MADQIDNFINNLAALKSYETRGIRIYRTGLKQWQKSAMLQKQIARYGEPTDKWARLTKTMDLRQHIHHEQPA